MKKLAIILLALLCLCACAPKAPEAEPEAETEEIDQDRYAQGNPVSTAKISHSYAIDVLDIRQVDYRGSSYPQIGGLKDKEVENAVNQMIRETFIELFEADVPPYVGIRQKLKRWENESCDRYVYSNVVDGGSFSNILSIAIFSHTNYMKDSYYDTYSRDDIFSYGDVRTLNIDLNTGKPIDIASLFVDGVDGIAYINDYIREKIKFSRVNDEADYSDYYSDVNFKLDGEFTGINREQKYYLDYSGRINIILDYENPWYLGVSDYDEILSLDCASLVIDISDVSAMEERFLSKETLFEKERKNHFLKQGRTLNGRNMVGGYENFENYRDNINLNYYKDCLYYSDLPSNILDYIEGYMKDDNIDFLIDVYANDRQTVANPDIYRGGIDKYLDVDTIGDFVHLDMRITFYSCMSDYNGYYVSMVDYQDYRNRYYRGEEAKPMKNSDFFVKGKDIDKVLKDVFLNNAKKRLADNGYAGEVDGNFAVLCDDVLANLPYTFRLYRDSMYIEYGGDLNEFVRKYYDNDSSWIYYSALSYVDYDDIGVENLTLFD